MCPSCGNHNYAAREVCNKCATPRPDGGGGYGAAAAGSKPAASPYSKPPAQMKEGDWICPMCSNHNYATRVKCNKCGHVKEGMREGDWICLACKAHNYASKPACFKCNAPRPMAPGQKGPMNMGQMQMGRMQMGGMMAGMPMGGMQMGGMMGGKGGAGGPPRPTFREGDWTCKSCQNHNFASRETCNKCG